MHMSMGTWGFRDRRMGGRRHVLRGATPLTFYVCACCVCFKASRLESSVLSLTSQLAALRWHDAKTQVIQCPS